MTTYEPPPDDTLFEDDYGPGITPPPEYSPGILQAPPQLLVNPDPSIKATLKLALAIDRLAAAIESTGNSRSPASGPPPAPPGPPQGYGAPARQGKTREQKMSGKVYAICRANNWDAADVGARILGRPVGGDSRTWSVEDLGAVLDGFKAWGVG